MRCRPFWRVAAHPDHRRWSMSLLRLPGTSLRQASVAVQVRGLGLRVLVGLAHR